MKPASGSIFFFQMCNPRFFNTGTRKYWIPTKSKIICLWEKTERKASVENSVTIGEDDYFIYLLKNFLWKSFLVVSFMKRCFFTGSDLDWCLNTTSSYHFFLILKSSLSEFMSGFPRSMPSALFCNSAALRSSSNRCLSASRSFVIFSNSFNNSASSESLKSG